MGVECSDENAIQLGAKRGAKRGGKSGGKSWDHDSFHLDDLRDWILWICAK